MIEQTVVVHIPGGLESQWLNIQEFDKLTNISALH